MLQIEHTTQKDLATLAEIYLEAYNCIVDLGEKWTRPTALELIKHFYKQQPDLFFTAHVDNKVIGGIVSSVKPWWDGNHLTDGELFVDPNFQGQGIGTHLLQKMFQVAEEKYGAVSWDTFTHRVHEHPLRWYKKMGFTEIAQWVMISGDLKKVLRKIDKDE